VAINLCLVRAESTIHWGSYNGCNANDYRRLLSNRCSDHLGAVGVSTAASTGMNY